MSLVGAGLLGVSRVCRERRWWLAVTTEVVPWVHPQGDEEALKGGSRWTTRGGRLEQEQPMGPADWKTWLGVGLALAVVAVLVVLIAANSGGGSDGLY